MPAPAGRRGQTLAEGRRRSCRSCQPRAERPPPRRREPAVPIPGDRSRATRAAFLSHPDNRIQFLYTPKHTSWISQIALRFSILARRVLKRGGFVSTDALRQRILAFIAHFNQSARCVANHTRFSATLD